MKTCATHITESHDHPHLHGSDQAHRPREQRRLLIAFSITFIMMVIEVVGGVLTNSLALISDAGHMLSHSFALVVSFMAIRIAMRNPTAEKSYGFYRVEVLAALFNGVTLFFIAGPILYHAYFRILSPEPIAEVQMFWIAVAGLFVNLLTAVVLHDVSHEDLNVKSAFMHMVGDTLSSVGVVIGAVIIYYTKWFILDPLLSIVIALLILRWSVKLIRMSVHILIEAAPKHISVESVTAEMKQLSPHIESVHDVHIWEITSKFYAMTAHINVPDISVKETSDITKKLNEHLDKTHHITHTNFQFECS